VRRVPADHRVRLASEQAKLISEGRWVTSIMSGVSSLGAVGARPNELMLYRCLVCGYQTLEAQAITEHLMSHAEAAKYAFSGVVKD
jgi:hypothetical protein